MQGNYWNQCIFPSAYCACLICAASRSIHMNQWLLLCLLCQSLGTVICHWQIVLVRMASIDANLYTWDKASFHGIMKCQSSNPYVWLIHPLGKSNRIFGQHTDLLGFVHLSILHDMLVKLAYLITTSTKQYNGKQLILHGKYI